MEDLFAIKRTQLEMVRDRGFDVSFEAPLLDYNLNQFVLIYSRMAQEKKIEFRDALTWQYESVDPNDKRIIYVYYARRNRGKQLSTDIVRTFIDYIYQTTLTEKPITDAILITEIPLSSSANSEITKFTQIRTQVFYDDDLKYNPTKHVLVPKHILLTQAEQNAFLQRNNLTLIQLPAIQNKDVIVRYYNWPDGRIVKIIRDNLLSNSLVTTTISYRVIIPT